MTFGFFKNSFSRLSHLPDSSDRPTRRPADKPKDGWSRNIVAKAPYDRIKDSIIAKQAGAAKKATKK